MTQKQKSSFIARFGALIAGGAILCGGIGVATVHGNSVAAENAHTEAYVQQLRSQLSSDQSSTEEQKEAVSSEVTGLSLERKAKDDAAIEAIMKQALTWASGDQYISARKALIERWHLDENSQFLKVFMPGEEAGAWRTDSSGKTYFAYEGANSKLDSFTSAVTDINGMKYSYFAVVGIKTTSSNGKATTTSYATMSYTIDGNGNVTDLTGWAGAPGLDRTY